MNSPMESEAFPPDICYSGEASSPSSHAWGKTLNESQETENESDADNAEDPLLCESGELNECENTAEGAAVEGAVGGKLPDLCNTVSRSLSPLMYKKLDENIADTLSHSHNCNSFACGESCSQNCDTIPVVDSTALVDSVDNENPNFSCGLVTDQIDEFKEESLDNESQNQTEKCVCSLYGNINFLPCETGDIEKRLKNILGAKYSLNRSCPESQFSVCCDISGALQEEIKEEEKQESPSVCGLEFVRENILHSSDPLFHDWKCCALIPSYLLMPVSLHSHGTSVGYEVGPPLSLAPSMGRSSSLGDETQPISEDEQIKLAKRFGLIRHLPCGVFDGSTKTRECVICMIDFSVGDRVRYLPCMHTYHTDCIDDWLMRSFTCPSCLEPVDAALLSTYETT